MGAWVAVAAAPGSAAGPRRRVLAVVAVVAAVLALAGPTRAQVETMQIDRFDVTLEVHADGRVSVTEQLQVDFGSVPRHGIYRHIPMRYDVEHGAPVLPEGVEAASVVRVTPITDVQVAGTAPADALVTEPSSYLGAGDLTIRIGSPDVTVTGRHVYVISYTVERALNAIDGRAELFWNATGDRWETDIRAAVVEVAGAPVLEATCFVGRRGSTEPCAPSRTDSTFRAGRVLAPGEGMSIGVAFDPEAVAVGDPLFEERWTPQKEMARRVLGPPWGVPVALVIVGAGTFTLLVLLRRHGRDRVASGRRSDDGVPAPMFRGRPTVRFRPPDDVRPAEVGVLLDERVDEGELSATIIDLARRGHLRLEERETKRLFWTKRDWDVIRPREGPAGDSLVNFERTLLNGLVTAGASRRLSSMRGKFATAYVTFQEQLYESVVKRGWFPADPSAVRARWKARGWLLVILSFVVGLTLFITIGGAVIGAAIFAVGVALIRLRDRMPRRTPLGSEVLREVEGFREFVVTADAARIAFAEREGTFRDNIAYAVLFGALDRWTESFAKAGIDAAALSGWYVSSESAMDLASFSGGVLDLGRMSKASLMAPAPSTYSTGSSSGSGSSYSSSGGSSFDSGGSSGGGMGGGGGGSW